MASTDLISAMTSRSVTVFAVSIALFAAATLFVFLRMLSRGWIVKRVTLDDYIMVLAWTITLGLTFTICYSAAHGLGRHEVDVPDAWDSSLRKSQYVFSVLYQPALMAEKVSILVFYLGLSKSNKIFRRSTIATMAVVVGVGFALTMFTVFQCRIPAQAYEIPRPVDARCTDIVTIYLSSAPVNIITDIAILVLPMPILTSMRLPKKQKIVLVITFSFGVFVAVVDVVRVAYLQNASSYRLEQVSNDKGGAFDQNATDFSWYASLSFMWTIIEVNVGIMCGCVPGIKPLVARFAPHLIHSEAGSQVQSKTDSGHTAELVERQRMPSMAPDAEFNYRDFAITHPAMAKRQSTVQRGGQVGGEMGMLDFLNSPDPESDRHSGPTEPAEMDMMDFLTTPDMAGTRSSGVGPNTLNRTDTVVTNYSRRSSVVKPTFFDFVNVQRRKSIVQMTTHESIFPCFMVSLLYFIWGAEYGILDVLNKQFQIVADISAGQNVALHSAYFAGYIIGPLTIGRLTLTRFGFKACYSVGLAIYATGTLIFWVAAVLTSFPAYLIVNIIVGAGLSVLETGANPFIALCGPPEYAEVRLNLSQGFQAIGTIVAPLVAQKGFGQYTNNAQALINTQWAYLGIALFTIAVAFAYYYIPLPEATDAELEDASERIDHAHKATIGPVRAVWITLGLGVTSMFFYVGAQEVISTQFGGFLTLAQPQADTTDYLAYGHTAFALSRFAAAGLGLFIRPRILLLAFYLGAILFTALAFRITDPAAAAALLVTTFALEGPLFSLIFAQALRGLGRHTKNCSVFLTAGIGGGAVFPALAYVAARRDDVAGPGGGPQYALCVAVAAFAGGVMFPVALNAVSKLARIVDPVKLDGGVGWDQARDGEKAGGQVNGLGILREDEGEHSRTRHQDQEERESMDGTSGREEVDRGGRTSSSADGVEK